MIDAHLADTSPRTAAVEAQRSFDAELALTNIARCAVALAGPDTPTAVLSRATAALSALLDNDRTAIVRAITMLRNADGRRSPPGPDLSARRLRRAVRPAREHLVDPVSDAEISAAGEEDFIPAVQLASGWLPGSVPVSTEASTTAGPARLDRVTILRTCAQPSRPSSPARSPSSWGTRSRRSG